MRKKFISSYVSTLLPQEDSFLKEKEKKLSYADLGKRFLIHPRTIQRWKERIEPEEKKERNQQQKNRYGGTEKRYKKNPDRYQWERAQDYDVSAWAIGRQYRLGITVKKILSHPKRCRKKEKIKRLWRGRKEYEEEYCLYWWEWI